MTGRRVVNGSDGTTRLMRDCVGDNRMMKLADNVVLFFFFTHAICVLKHSQGSFFMLLVFIMCLLHYTEADEEE